ncbi:hypothetical protein QJ48_14715 [Paenibacillus sp. A3]|nr:hypothetical protein QJ48_14715 [Paenibacillus sp. A3]
MIKELFAKVLKHLLFILISYIAAAREIDGRRTPPLFEATGLVLSVCSSGAGLRFNLLGKGE